MTFSKVITAAVFALGLAGTLCGQPATGRWSASTGDVSLVASGTTATIQQPASPSADIILEQIVVYSSVAATVTQAANGAAATATAGTVNPILPTPTNAVSPVNFFTASNVGGGTAQAGATHVPAGQFVTLCLNKLCGNAGDVVVGRGGGTASNYSVSIGSLSGTVNITFYFRTVQ